MVSRNDFARYKTYRQRRSLRLPTFDYAQLFIYYVTTATHKRYPLFVDPEPATVTLRCLIDHAKALDYQLFAFCLMPDHLHLLCQPLQDSSVPLQTFVGRFKGASSRRLTSFKPQSRLWQRGFYDHILRAEEDLWALARYIAENPVRKDLVTSYEEYSFSYIQGIKPYPPLM